MTMAQCVGWRKSSASYENGNCVEVSRHAEVVRLRDSKHPSGPFLEFSVEAWNGFLDAVACGRLDHLRLADFPSWTGMGRGPEACVVSSGVRVRDPSHPNGPVLMFTSAEWDAFIVGARQGELRPVALP